MKEQFGILLDHAHNCITANSMKTDLAWCAGIFDGEGCVSIGFVRPTPTNGLKNLNYRLAVKVTMGCKKTVLLFRRRIGFGTIQNHVASSDKVNASTSWVAMSRLAEHAIVRMYPFLVTKKAEADIALRFMRLPNPRRGGSRGSPIIDRGLLMPKHALYVLCCKAKSRFRFRKMPLPKFSHAKGKK